MTAQPMSAPSLPAETVTGKSTVPGFVTPKTVMTEFLVTAHRVSREAPASTVSVMSTVMMVTSAVPTVAGPAATSRFVSPASACPTVVTMPAVMAVTDEFGPPATAEVLVAMTTM